MHHLPHTSNGHRRLAGELSVPVSRIRVTATAILALLSLLFAAPTPAGAWSSVGSVCSEALPYGWELGLTAVGIDRNYTPYALAISTDDTERYAIYAGTTTTIEKTGSPAENRIVTTDTKIYYINSDGTLTSKVVGGTHDYTNIRCFLGTSPRVTYAASFTDPHYPTIDLVSTNPAPRFEQMVGFVLAIMAGLYIVHLCRYRGY